ncbi:MAG: hypothetical protein H6719_33390, partial [Sandaracinaceae bacterium]|nr:hypothetical protein [Sandaracinaceae bacterium]
MIIDTDRVRRHIQAALASLPLLACAPPATPDPEITQRSAPIAAEPMTALDTRETIPEAAPSRPVRVVAEPEDPRRRARELHHAELRKHPPRPVAGRPLRVNGRDVIACLRRVDATGEGRPLGLDLMPEARAEVAAQWMLDARHEHA